MKPPLATTGANIKRSSALGNSTTVPCIYKRVRSYGYPITAMWSEVSKNSGANSQLIHQCGRKCKSTPRFFHSMTKSFILTFCRFVIPMKLPVGIKASARNLKTTGMSFWESGVLVLIRQRSTHMLTTCVERPQVCARCFILHFAYDSHCQPSNLRRRHRTLTLRRELQTYSRLQYPLRGWFPSH